MSWVVGVEARLLQTQQRFMTLKGSNNTTVGAFRRMVARSLPGQQAADDVVLLYRGTHLSDATQTLAQCGVLDGTQVDVLIQSSEPQLLSLEVKTLKGQLLSNLSVSPTTTVAQLKTVVSGRLNGQPVGEMKLLYRAKYLSDEGKTLQDYGIKTGAQVHLVSRFTGGKERSAMEEVAHQLRIVKRSDLPCLELVELDDDDEMAWNLLLRGPADGPYAGGLFSLTFTFPDDYPYTAPGITFNTPIYHPNVFPCGEVCWSETDSGASKFCADVLIGAVNLLLEEPNVDSPANGEATALLISDKAAFTRHARAMTELHAFQ